MRSTALRRFNDRCFRPDLRRRPNRHAVRLRSLRPRAIRHGLRKQRLVEVAGPEAFHEVASGEDLDAVHDARTGFEAGDDEPLERARLPQFPQSAQIVLVDGAPRLLLNGDPLPDEKVDLQNDNPFFRESRKIANSVGDFLKYPPDVSARLHTRHGQRPPLPERPGPPRGKLDPLTPAHPGHGQP